MRLRQFTLYGISPQRLQKFQSLIIGREKLTVMEESNFRPQSDDKNMKKSILEKCNYCEGKGYDIFNRSKQCPFCDEMGESEKKELLNEKLHLEFQLGGI